MNRDASQVKDRSQMGEEQRKAPAQGSRVAASTREQHDDAGLDPAQAQQLQQQYKTQQAKAQAPQHAK